MPRERLSSTPVSIAFRLNGLFGHGSGDGDGFGSGSGLNSLSAQWSFRTVDATFCADFLVCDRLNSLSAQWSFRTV